jgi:5-methylcytosine-specific restriction endonuclease McrA
MPTSIQVFVLDKQKKPLMPCHPARARELLREKKAVVHRLVPFTIRLKDRVGGDTQPVRVCEDPGSKTTGIAVVRETPAATEASLDANGDDVSGPNRTVLFKIELQHRGADIHKRMESRKSLRRGRRSRKTRYREQRYSNRSSSRRKGRLPPSLKHRVETTMTWTKRLSRLVPVTAISVERVRFDTQLMENPEISGVEYQQGTLKGYETREYVLEKWGRSCAYCDKENVPLQLDHVRPKSKGGSSRPTDFAPACGPCNQKKGAQPVEAFLKRDPKRLAKIVAGLKAPMRDAAAVNATRWALDAELRTLGVPVDAATGGRTKWNRSRFSIAKTHANDAICVGRVGGVAILDRPTLYVRCAGRGDYGRTNVTASGFPRGCKMREKYVHGFRTGDIVRAVVPSGKKRGTHTGRVAVRATGNFAVFTSNGRVDGISHRRCRVVQSADGYDYAWTEKKRTEKADAVAV